MESGDIVGGRFRVGRFLGKGSMSQVWQALDGGRRVALKVADDGGDGALALKRAAARLVSEAEVLALLDHPNVPHLIAADVVGPTPYLAMELIDGVSLEQEVGRRAKLNDPLPLEDLVRLIDEVASTLHYAHSMKVVHRDLKPSNLMLLNRAGRLYVKVLDFGVAKVLQQEARDETTHGRIIGTPLYLSPEQVFASGQVSAKSDVFSLGVLIFELLTMHRAWVRGEDHRPLPSWRPTIAIGGNSKGQVLNRITKGPRPSAVELRPDLPPEIDEVLHRALAIAPEDRQSSPIELAQELRQALAGSVEAEMQWRTVKERSTTMPERATPTKPMSRRESALPRMKYRSWVSLCTSLRRIFSSSVERDRRPAKRA